MDILVWSVLSVLFILIPFGLFVAFIVAVIRYIWKKGNNAKHQQ